ncbi:MAG: NUDIX hydrolase [Patescibacteria group bacterium]
MSYRESTIPENAKLVFKGQIFDVYQWEQEMFDGSKEIFEMLKRPDTVQVLAVTEDKKIIMLDEEQPGRNRFVGLPGGRMDEGEDPVTAAKRELLEETGYAGNDWKLIRENGTHGKIDWVIYHFVVKGCRKISAPKLDVGEKINMKLVSFDEFLQIVGSSEHRDVDLNNYLNELRLQPSGLESLRKALGL